MYYKICLLLVHCISYQFIFIQTLWGQEDSSAKDIMNKYKNGAAIVRLYMNKPKTDLLHKSIASTDNPIERKALQKMLDEHLTSREKYKLKIIKAFIENYKFAKTYFIYDYNIVKLNEGIRSGIFLNDKGDIDNSITMSENNYLIFKRGNDDNKIELISPDNQALPSIIPTKYNRNIGSIFSQLFNPKDELSESIEKLNKAHFKLHDKLNRPY
jgi:hypothetical protein